MDRLSAAELLLLAQARDVQEAAYAPYSKFRVGAAVFTAEGDIFRGVNVENAAYGATLCAERNALANAVAHGFTDIQAIAVVGDSDTPTVPCGCCRQALAEFNPEMRVIMGGQSDEVKAMTLDELLPEAFVKGYLDQDETK
jgi:cytidine deaminase